MQIFAQISCCEYLQYGAWFVIFLGREPQKKTLGAVILQISQKKIKLSPFTLILV